MGMPFPNRPRLAQQRRARSHARSRPTIEGHCRAELLTLAGVAITATVALTNGTIIDQLVVVRTLRVPWKRTAVPSPSRAHILSVPGVKDAGEHAPARITTSGTAGRDGTVEIPIAGVPGQALAILASRLTVRVVAEERAVLLFGAVPEGVLRERAGG